MVKSLQMMSAFPRLASAFCAAFFRVLFYHNFGKMSNDTSNQSACYCLNFQKTGGAL